MAVQTVQKKNNTLGMLGTLASIGGAAFGVPWLGALGTGMQGMNAMKNGDSSMQTSQATSGAMNELLNSLQSGWKNPAKTAAQNATEKAQELLGTDEELAKKWTVPQYSFVSPKEPTFGDILGKPFLRAGLDVATNPYSLGTVLFPYEYPTVMY